MRAKAERDRETAERFRIGYEREEQKRKELEEQKTKETQTVTKHTEKLTTCKGDLESVIKKLTGESDVSS